MAQVEKATSKTGKKYLTNVLSVFEFPTGQSITGTWVDVGFIDWQENYDKTTAEIQAHIPKNFKIVDAFITMYHTPRYLQNIYGDVWEEWCYSRKIKLYNATNLTNRYVKGLNGSEYAEFGQNLIEIEGAFGPNGFTGKLPTSIDPINATEKVESINLKDSLLVGESNYLKIMSDDTLPTSEKEAAQKTGQIIATLTVTGYSKEVSNGKN